MQIVWDKICERSPEKLEKMYAYIDSLIDIKYEVEMHGIMGFNDFLDSRADSFEKFAIWLVTSGTEPELCKNMLSNVLNSSSFDNDSYLKNAIFSEFISTFQTEKIGIQELSMRLYSYLGIDGISKLYI